MWPKTQADVLPVMASITRHLLKYVNYLFEVEGSEGEGEGRIFKCVYIVKRM